MKIFFCTIQQTRFSKKENGYFAVADTTNNSKRIGWAKPPEERSTKGDFSFIYKISPSNEEKLILRRADLILVKKVDLVIYIQHIYGVNICDSDNPLRTTWNLLSLWVYTNYPVIFQQPTLGAVIIRLLQMVPRTEENKHLAVDDALLNLFVDLNEILKIFLTNVLDEEVIAAARALLALGN